MPQTRIRVPLKSKVSPSTTAAAPVRFRFSTARSAELCLVVLRQDRFVVRYDHPGLVDLRLSSRLSIRLVRLVLRPSAANDERAIRDDRDLLPGRYEIPSARRNQRGFGPTIIVLTGAGGGS